MPTGDIFYLLDLITLRGLRLRFSLLAFNARRDFQEPVARKLRFGLEGIFFITALPAWPQSYVILVSKLSSETSALRLSGSAQMGRGRVARRGVSNFEFDCAAGLPNFHLAAGTGEHTRYPLIRLYVQRDVSHMYVCICIYVLDISRTLI